MSSDPEEFVGSTNAVKADPKGAPKKTTAPAAPVASKLAPDLGTPKAVYTPPVKGEAHPKIARKAAAERLDAATAALNLSQAEVIAARHDMRAAEIAETECLEALLRVLPGPTYAEVNTARLQSIQAEKQARADQGLPVTEKPKATHGNSAIDIAAANRPRTSQALPTGAPLRSPVARRLV